ncbi:metal ABC transporter permease [Jeotgalicoccus sp. ATCC 8456]|uniref:metal ABC transporter permease n=1 Tax=Jeotgalicoccus sp. ATCC 8456 TaxID=946435 RepID=UPI0018E5EF44|nr:iron chelate uptake ABC transporter family permease subunit [Jeotgalicoccus sp. ATCC 8456]QQD84226.1 metal ABC transporter permease [Jeotgalicoccus sp. ATCC 8456]
MDILTSYSFIIVALGTVILAIASGVVGTVSVLKGQSLIGDAIGHATFPGVVIAFMIFGMMETSVLVIGAVIFGVLAFWFINKITSESKTSLDSALALILSSFFGLGMVLKSYVQGNSNFSGTQGIDDFIFGQAAYMLKSDVYIIIAAALINLLIFIISYHQLRIYIFDETYSRTIGINKNLMNALVLLMTIVLISVGLKAVGAILMVNILIIPAVIGSLWSNRFLNVLIIAGISGVVSAFIGTYVSTAFTGIPTGPAIILSLSILFILSLIVAPKGLGAKIIQSKKRGANI